MNPLRWLWKQVFDDDDPPEPNQLVILGEPPGEMVAELWKSKLEAEGIESLVKNVSPLAAYGFPSFEVLVHYKDLDPARRLLNLDTPARRERRNV